MRTYTTIDKAEWGPGEWQNEPDKLSWTDEATGLPCLIVRNSGGALCGYVGVDPTHPWHGVDYGDCVDPDAEHDGDHGWHYECAPEGRVGVHGGLTYADGCQHSASEDKGICHIPEPGASDDVWWFGFDTAHAYDLKPSYASRGGMFAPFEGETYKDVGYVRSEVASLARQIAKVKA